MKTELETKMSNIAERLSLLDTKENETKLRIDTNSEVNDIKESLKDFDKRLCQELTELEKCNK